MNVFALRDRLISEYEDYVRGFVEIRDERIRDEVDRELGQGLLWPDPLIQLNPSFEPGETIDELVDKGILHRQCRRIFQDKKPDGRVRRRLRLHRHQSEAVKIARQGHNYVLTTGTGSGKSLAYIIPTVDHVLRTGSGRGIQAIIVYPMNALANSQEEELRKFLCFGYPEGKPPVTFARYTGQERLERKQEIVADPPDILLTNYVMLELILTRTGEKGEKGLIKAAQGLRFLVLDELHTYRGRQGADVALLVRRTRDVLSPDDLQCVGTSATLAGSGNYDEQRREVAEVVTEFFGAAVRPEHVIGETLRRLTDPRDPADPAFVAALRERIEHPPASIPTGYESFLQDPLSSWIESTFGIATEPDSGRLIRTTPRSVTGPRGAARELAEITGLPEDRCRQAIQDHLLASYKCIDPETGFSVFAFRLHQFLSGGDTVYASVEPESQRYLTVRGQQFVPGDRDRVLYPLVFCRECGQEYYCVRVKSPDKEGIRQFVPRDLSDRLTGDEDGEDGFLYLSTDDPWPQDPEEGIQRLPDDWTEESRGRRRVRSDRRRHLPQPVWVEPSGIYNGQGVACHFIRAPFRFCLRCGVSYDFRQRTDYPKLASLGTGGRSTSTTILSLATIRHLRSGEELPLVARKLLSFTDNRQDASLQAGHFNDFVEIGLLRSALFRAAEAAGPEGLRHDALAQRVFEALDLPLDLYASKPKVQYDARKETDRALRDVLEYRLFRDLRRGWRITSPNLEQSGLLRIEYRSLDDLCRDPSVWQDTHPALEQATPEERAEVVKVLLDYMRRELAIKVDALNPTFQEKIRHRSAQHLIPPWALDEDEGLEEATILLPRSRFPKAPGGWLFLSPRGSFARYLRRNSPLRSYADKLKQDDLETICRRLLEAMTVAGLVEVVRPARSDDQVPGYQVPASCLVWKAGDGKQAFHDPLRAPRAPEGGGRTNPFFVDFYREVAAEGAGIEAHEHTAQVKYDLRVDREEKFREGRLPILFCSPTMELGIDIKQLNAVNMRNMPPTPANYAQRSGRAGRSGQPALVFTYCSTFSPHDRFFFKRPPLMVAGAVSPPRLDLANEDLIRAHVHAIWLAEAELGLGTSLKDLLDCGAEGKGNEPSLALQPDVRDALEDETPLRRARTRARRVLDSVGEALTSAHWYHADWLDDVLRQIPARFEEACERWRALFRAAWRQQVRQDRIIKDVSRDARDKARAKRLRAEAESQLELLAEAKASIDADFYSYRYFASEGFLPGYNFPRLPLSAYIPGRRRRKQARDEFLSRPRFLAISEFGPRAIIYHEGSRYRIHKVILPPSEREGEDVATHTAKRCDTCGYLHLVTDEPGPDLCERCGCPLGAPFRNLFRLQNVATRRAEKINSDEEERLRMGYEIETAIRFSEAGGRSPYRTAAAKEGEARLVTLTYGPAATIWRINMGWKRRADPGRRGFILDMERGFWARNKKDFEDDDQDPLSPRTVRVIPYVEDRKNCLLLESGRVLSAARMASLAAALKSAIQVLYQLEETELAAEPLPSPDIRRLILFYEAGEGGAGVLRQLVDDREALARVARQALELCHFDPETGEDLRRAENAREDCEAACYDCLLSYTNQPDHPILDRHLIKEFLLRLTRADVEISPVPDPRQAHLERLLRQCESELEARWVRFFEAHKLRLPSRAQVFIPECETRPDFLYDKERAAIYVDGPHHEYPDRRKRDKDQTEAMEDRGYTVIRFAHDDDWPRIVGEHPSFFGRMA